LIVNGIKMILSFVLHQIIDSILNKDDIKNYLVELLNEIGSMILMAIIFVKDLIVRTINLRNLSLI
jgi:hypothetical protein